jgi:hypothetical protein
LVPPCIPARDALAREQFDIRTSNQTFVTHPGAGTLTYRALFALGNAVLISTVAIAIRRMSMTEATETLTLYQGEPPS